METGCLCDPVQTSVSLLPIIRGPIRHGVHSSGAPQIMGDLIPGQRVLILIRQREKVHVD